jgi:nucleoside-diphosphate-sugar epimerase
MYAVIGGAGEVGLHIAHSLYDEGYTRRHATRPRPLMPS